MKRKTIIRIVAVLITLIVVGVLAAVLKTTTMVDCPDCGGEGINLFCETCEGSGKVAADSWYYSTFMALIPPIIAIALALITKEVFSSLFIGIVAGALLNANFAPVKAADLLINEGLIPAVSGTAGIFIFLVVLGIMVALINRAGGSEAFGRWAEKHIKTKVGAMLATFALGVLIFIDDYFNCLTVGSVMRPVTDVHQISRVKLAFLIDATAAPVCMIAPISSWAAAVSGYVEQNKGFNYFCAAIPFNFYSLLTLVFVITIALMGFDYGKMSKYDIKTKADNTGDSQDVESEEKEEVNIRGRVYDLIIPVLLLILSCVLALMYVGGFFDSTSDNYLNLIHAFGDTDATVGLPLGSLAALVLVILYFIARRLMSFGDAMKAIPKGFIAMVPAILILTLATALKNMTGLLGADSFVAGLVESAQSVLWLIPAIVFLVACGLAFATGTSWGTFGILIPIVSLSIPLDTTLGIIAMSACLAGAVCGDHCSPISDTTIMSSAGAGCNHVDHVSTQMPYALTVAAVSFVSYVITGLLVNFVTSSYIVCAIALPIAIALMIGTLFVIRAVQKKKA